MKNHSKFVLFLVFNLVLFKALAQSSEEMEIRKIEETATKAFLETDTTTLKKLWDKNYVVRNPFNKIVGVKEIMGLVKNQKITQVKFTTIIDKVTINQNIAIVMGHDEPDNKTAMLGVATEVLSPRFFTNIWMKTDGNWRQIARQATNVCSDLKK